MEFDKSRVYTALNADEVKPGSKVLVADDLSTLRRVVEGNTEHYLDTLSQINPDDYGRRFDVNGVDYALCYLVAEPNKPRRMTNRELAKWLAQNKGQWMGSSCTIGMSYSYTRDNNKVPDGIMIRGWDEAEWREPIVEEADE